MSENQSLEKLQFEMQTVTAELKARKKALKRLERDTQTQIREMDLNMQWHTALVNSQTEGYEKYTGLVKETIEDLNSILRNMIANAKGEAPDNTADLIEKLELNLLHKSKTENARMLEVSRGNVKKHEEIPELAQQIYDKYTTEKTVAAEFSLQAEARIKELEESINRVKSGHE